jgi:hypothetical protein
VVHRLVVVEAEGCLARILVTAAIGCCHRSREMNLVMVCALQALHPSKSGPTVRVSHRANIGISNGVQSTHYVMEHARRGEEHDIVTLYLK